MKNSTTTIKNKVSKCVIVLSLILTCTSIHSQSQMVTKRISFATSSTGSGFGAMYNPGLCIKKGRSQFEGVIDIQRTRLNVSGGQFTYEYSFFDGTTDGEVGDPIPVEMFGFSNIRYSSSAFLGQNQIRIEKSVSSDRRVDLGTLKYSALEGYVGFGIKVHVGTNTHLLSSIGFGGWTTLKGRGDIYRDLNSQSISLKIGLSFDLN